MELHKSFDCKYNTKIVIRKIWWLTTIYEISNMLEMLFKICQLYCLAGVSPRI